MPFWMDDLITNECSMQSIFSILTLDNPLGRAWSWLYNTPSRIIPQLEEIHGKRVVTKLTYKGIKFGYKVDCSLNYNFT